MDARHAAGVHRKPGEKVPEQNAGKQVVKDENDPFFGGWGYGGRSRGGGRPDLSNARLAIEALKEAGLKEDDPAFQNAIKFVTRQQNNSRPTTAPGPATTAASPTARPTTARRSRAGEYKDDAGERASAATAR